MKADPNSKNLKPITNRFSVNQSRHLGKGCFGNVYEGLDHATNKVIAVKHLNQPENFKGEIETLQKLSTLVHPNIMGFYGYKVDEKDVYLFVEYCPGGVLTDYIKKGIEEEQVLDLFRQLIEGMCYLNAKQIMHRDLKPDNILMGSNKDIKISDFGLARVQDGLEKTGQTGTPLYAGPEIYTNYVDSYNYNCDVWSAGLILHEMLTGQHPFEHITSVYELKDQWKMFEKGEKRISYPKNIHPQWEYITNIMLTHNFKKRPMFHDILELLKKLDDNGTMRKEIRNSQKGIKSQQNSKQATLEKYLSFIQQKSDMIVELAQKLTPEKCPFIRPSLQWLLLFLSVTWYTIKIKNLVRSLKFKNLKYPNKADVIDRKNPDDKNNLIMDKFRNVFEVKLTKYQNFLKEKVLPKLEQQQAKPEELKLFKSLETAYKLYLQAKQGSYDVEQTYQQQYTKVLSFHKLKPTEEKVSLMTDPQAQIYATVLLIGFLNSEFPDTGFADKNTVQGRLAQINGMKRVELNQYINKLRARLK